MDDQLGNWGFGRSTNTHTYKYGSFYETILDSASESSFLTISGTYALGLNKMKYKYYY